MATLLRQGARTIGGSVLQRTKAAVTSPAVAEERRRLVPRRMLSTDKGIADGKKSLKDVSDQVSPTPGGFNWREIPFESYSKAVAKICNGVIKGGFLLAVAVGVLKRPTS